MKYATMLLLLWVSHANAQNAANLQDQAKRQDQANVADKIANFPGSFFNAINKKTNALDKDLTSQTEKYIRSCPGIKNYPGTR